MPQNNKGFSGQEMRGKTWTLEEARNVDFENYDKIVKKFEGRGDYSRENQPFAYPGPLSRNISQNGEKIRRGFIRSIIMGGDIADALLPSPTGKGTTAPGNIRLNFQFNPEYIERTVQQSIGAVNPLLQNPANLTQAVPGTATFNFTMMFNREAEVAATAAKNALNLNLFAGEDFDQNSIDSALKDPGQVGVMHDLSLFDSIIGQGITKELVSTITKYTHQQVIAMGNAALTDASEEDKNKLLELTGEQSTAFDKSINANFGNSAFLNPMPVRIVFSDLFMVEGLVTSSAVAFQKFNQNMIPTIAQVNCNVQALYVGFAKKKAYLSDTLTSWAVAQKGDQDAQAAAITRARAEMLRRIKGIKVIFNSSEIENQQNNDDNALSAPTYNSVGMRVLNPNISSSFYPGNNSTYDTRFVTVPQWFNTFAGSQFYPVIGTNVSQTVRAQFLENQQNSNSKFDGELPVSVFIEYNHMFESTTQQTPTGPKKVIQPTPLDADFNISWQLRDDSTGTKKGLITRYVSQPWKEANYPLYGIKEVDNTYAIYNNVYRLFPDTVTNKNTIKSGSKCTIILTLTMTQSVQGISAPVSLTFKPIEIPFQSTTPLYYDLNANATQHRSTVKALRVFNPSGGTGTKVQ